MKYYSQLTKRQATSALEEFLAERAPALEQFRQALSGDGQDLDAMLDGTTQGLIPLWSWVLNQITGPDDAEQPVERRHLFHKLDDEARHRPDEGLRGISVTRSPCSSLLGIVGHRFEGGCRADEGVAPRAA
ncbi:hypothetical protein RCH21_000707 [Arthrobacter sp. PL16]|uniref:Uncharacterized protein n=1 Tax=Arthrobacter cheniae TaxID=1258888 RepID=A0A3A5MD98_9MICC|nr:hypothetical protein [Arthrobacter sp. PL16]MEC5198499.1 hypothetical protein [Arthrobacter sp. PL16]RJT81790.1 hypothetical protein D6T63_03230 [Arthrobacter cheniae]